MTTFNFAETDPLTRVYRKLWALLEAEDAFTRLVPRGNRIKLDGSDRSPEKDQLATADHPQVRIAPASGEIRLFDTGGLGRAGGEKGGSTIIQNFEVQILTGDQRVTPKLMPITWAVAKAIGRTKEENLDLDYVTDVRIDANAQLDRDAEGRALNGWVALLNLRVDMDIDTQLELQA